MASSRALAVVAVAAAGPLTTAVPATTCPRATQKPTKRTSPTTTTTTTIATTGSSDPKPASIPLRTSVHHRFSPIETVLQHNRARESKAQKKGRHTKRQQRGEARKWKSTKDPWAHRGKVKGRSKGRHS